jgi:Flp pilus assembly protein TadG
LQRNQRTGVTAVEFAFVLPVFIILLAVAFEFGRLNIIRHTADNAAYEAARYAMVPGATPAEAVAKANSLLNVVSTRGATVTVNPAILGPETEEVVVTIDIPMSQNGWFLPRFSTTKTIRSQSRMKTERTQ